MKNERKRTTSWKWGSFIIAIQLCTLLAIPCFGAEDASKFPSKPITLVHPWGAGGTSDLLARRLAEIGGKILGQPIVVVNKPGGGGVMAVNMMRNSDPDGYTIGTVTPSPFVTAPLLRSVPYDVKKDFSWIVQFCDVAHLFGVLPEARWKTIQDFMEDAKKNPGKLTYSTSAARGLLHMFMVYVSAKEKVQLTHVPTNGGAEVITNVLGGHVNAGFVSDLFRPMNAGQVRGLAVASRIRIPAIPDVPTFYELYDLHLPTWFGINAPAGIDPKILRKLENALSKAAEDPYFKELVTSMHLVPYITVGESFKALVHRDYELQKEVIKNFEMAK